MRVLAVLVALGVAASCGAPASPPAAGPVAPSTVRPTAPGGAATAAPAAPAYLSTTLTDVRTGEQFTLGQLASGKQVLVQGMAVW